MNQKVGSRYEEGFIVGQMDTRKEWGDTDSDYLIKRLIISASPACESGEKRDLVLHCEVEVCGIGDKEDEFYIEIPIEVFRIPFPSDFQVRKQVIRQWASDSRSFRF